MILYTMMPQELIFPAETAAQSKQLMVTCEGVPLLVELTEQQDVQVVRVLSTDPQHFMEDRFMPGAKISFATIDGLSSL